MPDVPVLDEAETRWSELQRQRLAGALLTLDAARSVGSATAGITGAGARRGWPRDAGVDEAAMRKRLQRIRDKLRKEMEVAEQRGIRPEEIRPDFPAKVVELLARPQLTDLPENPVGRDARAAAERVSPDFAEQSSFPRSSTSPRRGRRSATTRCTWTPHELHRVDDDRILRYDLTLPLLLTVRYEGQPLRIWAAGKAYRVCQIDATHLEAFHQAEVFWLDERTRLDPGR